MDPLASPARRPNDWQPGSISMTLWHKAPWFRGW
jgi:hypothetical protein